MKLEQDFEQWAYQQNGVAGRFEVRSQENIEQWEHQPRGEFQDDSNYEEEK